MALLAAARALLALLLLADGAARSLGQVHPNSTAPADYDALLGFLAAVGPVDGTLLAQWDATDPCLGGWPGVLCDCGQLPRAAAAACSAATTANSSSSSGDGLRVRGLDLGPLASAGAARLRGSISPLLGNLSELLYLDLSGNELG